MNFETFQILRNIKELFDEVTLEMSMNIDVKNKCCGHVLQ